MSELLRSEPMVVYLDASGDAETYAEAAAQLAAIGVAVRPGVAGECGACGFLRMVGRDDGALVFDYCVCEVRRAHVDGCLFRLGREQWIEVVDPDTCGCTCGRAAASRE